MNIQLKKFGTTLISRQAGREAFNAFQSTLTEIKEGEGLMIDFDGVITFSPSWGDEFLTPLLKQFNDKLILTHVANPSVQASLHLLMRINKQKFTFGD